MATEGLSKLCAGVPPGGSGSPGPGGAGAGPTVTVSPKGSPRDLEAQPQSYHRLAFLLLYSGT